MADIEIEIDGRLLKATANQTVIQVADSAGIYIPRFCYHKHLSIPANCRMCLVEVEKSPKALPACATPVMHGMKVMTKSAKTIAAQRAVMEFLLINHPLDCPICDQGGECELQDLSMGYGSSHSVYQESKRAVANDNLGPLIATEMTRCILCTRCIRFGDEVAGLRELGMTFRGETEQVTTFVKHAMQSEMSGNIIDLCPVGALTSKPYQFSARPWELDQSFAVSPHDCLGSHLKIHTRYGKVMRVVAEENEALNLTWISDRDRFSYCGLYHPMRLESPKIKVRDKWQTVGWQDALQTAVAGIKSLLAKHGPDELGALASPQSTTEEFYLLSSLMRALGSSNVDHRLREIDVSDQTEMGLFPRLPQSLAELEKSDVVLLIGSNIQKEQPLLAVRLQKLCTNGGEIIAVNPVDYRFTFPIAQKEIIAPQHFLSLLQTIIAHLKNDQPETIPGIEAMVSKLKNSERGTIILGAIANHHPQASKIRSLVTQLAELTNLKINILTDGGNAAGAWFAGAIPHREARGVSLMKRGLTTYEMLTQPRKGLLLLNVEPDLDLANALLAKKALAEADFVVALSLFQNDWLDEHADVILPLAAFTETAGTYINALGDEQTVNGVAKPFGESRPGWKILRALANFLELAGFQYQSAGEVLAALKAQNEANRQPESSSSHAEPFSCHPEQSEGSHSTSTQTLSRIGDIPIYAIDSLVRHSMPLTEAQTIMEGNVAALRIHTETANKHAITLGQSIFVKQAEIAGPFTVELDDSIAKDAIWLAGGLSSATGLGDLFGPIEIYKDQKRVNE